MTVYIELKKKNAPGPYARHVKLLFIGNRALKLTETVPQRTFLEPRSVEDAQELIKWLNTWIDAQHIKF